MTHIVKDELEAGSIEGRRAGDLVRSKSDPTVLLGGKSGNIYRRADGKPWEWPGYRRPTIGSDLEPWTAFDDTRVIRDVGDTRVDHKQSSQRAVA